MVRCTDRTYHVGQKVFTCKVGIFPFIVKNWTRISYSRRFTLPINQLLFPTTFFQPLGEFLMEYSNTIRIFSYTK